MLEGMAFVDSQQLRALPKPLDQVQAPSGAQTHQNNSIHIEAEVRLIHESFSTAQYFPIESPTLKDFGWE